MSDKTMEEMSAPQPNSTAPERPKRKSWARCYPHDEADAYMDAIEAELAQLRAEIERKDTWISVDERLPDSEEMVLTYGFSDALRVIYWRQEVARCLSPNELRYWNNNGHIKPTHWRPLPAPPADRDTQKSTQPTPRDKER